MLDLDCQNRLITVMLNYICAEDTEERITPPCVQPTDNVDSPHKTPPDQPL